MNNCKIIQNQKNCARLKCKIKSVEGYISLILDASEFILSNLSSFSEVVINKNNITLDCIVIFQDRLYCFINKNKYFTVNFPIHINEAQKTIHLGNAQLTLAAISRLKSSLEDLIKGLTNGNTTIEDVNSQLTPGLSQNELRFMERLLTVEFGYVRYDYDEDNHNGRIHPLNHLDFNFSKAKYKVGLYDRLSPYDFFMIFGRDDNQECMFLEKVFKFKWMNSVLRKISAQFT